MATVARLRRPYQGRKGRNPLAAEDAIAGWIFILPAVIILGVFFFGPVMYALWVSFRERDTIGTVNDFNGIDNYRHIFTENRDFWQAFRNTTWFALIVVPAADHGRALPRGPRQSQDPGQGFFRTAFYFPSISSSVVISIIFVWLYAKNGLLVFLMTKIGLDEPRRAWLADPRGLFELTRRPATADDLRGAERRLDARS